MSGLFANLSFIEANRYANNFSLYRVGKFMSKSRSLPFEGHPE